MLKYLLEDVHQQEGKFLWTELCPPPQNSSVEALSDYIWKMDLRGNIKVKWGPGNGNPLQCSCLENPRDGGGWWAAIYGVAQGWTWLKQLGSSSSKDWALAQENWCLYKKRDRYKTLCAHTQKRSHVSLEKRKRKRKGREEKRKRKICHTRNQPWCQLHLRLTASRNVKKWISVT